MSEHGDRHLKVGDRVRRDDIDVHEVISLTDDGFAGEFKCIIAPSSGWCKVGDVEYNLAYRYTLLCAETPSRTPTPTVYLGCGDCRHRGDAGVTGDA